MLDTILYDAPKDDAMIHRIGTTLDTHVGGGRVVGATIVAARDGDVVGIWSKGWADREAGLATGDDTIYRMASLTKPVVSAAALALVEKGALGLDGVVRDWLPDFHPKSPDGRTPDITIRHLLGHTSGLGYRFLQPPDGPYHRFDVSDGLDIMGVSAAENLRRINAAPLLFEPGAGWCYSVSTDILGEVVARAHGGTLAQAVAALVTEPLGMTDTRFADKHPARLSTAYIDRETGPARMIAGDALPFGTAVSTFMPDRPFDPHAYQSGGSGMSGTAPDYLKLLEALRRGGAPILSPESVRLMTTNTVAPGSVFIPGPGWGFGLGFGVLLDPAVAQCPSSPGTWGWFGVFGSHFWVDPVRRLTLVAMTNTAISGMIGPFADDLRAAMIGGD